MTFIYRLLLIAYLLCAGVPAIGSMPQWVGVEILSFSQTKAKPETIYATDNHGIFRSNDRGRSWSPIFLPKNIIGSRVLTPPEDHNHLVLWSDIPTTPTGLGFDESLDGGGNWARRPLNTSTPLNSSRDQKGRITDFRIDLEEEGGAWWLVWEQQLLRSTDRGSTWTTNAANLQDKLLLLHTNEWSFRLSGNTLFRSSDRGYSWQLLNALPIDRSGEKTYGTDLFRLADGKLLLRVNDVWFRAANNGEDALLESEGMANLPDQRKEKLPASRGTSSNTYCRVRQATDSLNSLFAFCAWDNHVWPTSLCVHRSDDGGKSWVRPPGSDVSCHTDLPPWSPVSIWMDSRDPNSALVSWMAGGIFRTEDGGRSWATSDRGLRFGSLNMELGTLAIHEPPLIRAVLERDKLNIEKLLADGADINMTGNEVDGALEADLMAHRFDRERNAQHSLYHYLRSKGAIPRLPRRADEGLIRLACELQSFDIVDDLIASGYPWAERGDMSYGERPKSELALCISLIGSVYANKPEQPLDRWIDRYIGSGKFWSADQIVIDLFDGDRLDLALKLLKAASRKTALDAQSTPASPRRISIVSRLWKLKEFRWAQRVFLSSDRNNDSLEFGYFSLALDGLCQPEIVEWYVAKGARVSYESCIRSGEVSRPQQIRMLSIMESRGQLSDQDWLRFIEDTDTRWVEDTPAYRQRANRIERLRGLIGIGYKTEPDKGLVVTKVYPLYPADKIGLRAGDIIVRINGNAITHENVDKLAASIRGVPGTSVKLNVRRDSNELQFTIARKRWP